MLSKIDLKKDLKHLYSASAKAFSIVDVPPLQYLMIDGEGDPNTVVAYKQAVEALYAVAYTVKFKVKRSQGLDYAVMPLEGLWHAKDMSAFNLAKRELWQWTMMISQPDMVTAADVTASIEEVKKKKSLPALGSIRLETYNEGKAAQILYFGVYKDEGPTIERLHAYIHENGGQLSGKHHEIYIGDPRRAAPEKLKTIIRQPFSIAR